MHGGEPRTFYEIYVWSFACNLHPYPRPMRRAVFSPRKSSKNGLRIVAELKRAPSAFCGQNSCLLDVIAVQFAIYFCVWKKKVHRSSKLPSYRTRKSTFHLIAQLPSRGGFCHPCCNFRRTPMKVGTQSREMTWKCAFFLTILIVFPEKDSGLSEGIVQFCGKFFFQETVSPLKKKSLKWFHFSSFFRLSLQQNPMHWAFKWTTNKNSKARTDLICKQATRSKQNKCHLNGNKTHQIWQASDATFEQLRQTRTRKTKRMTANPEMHANRTQENKRATQRRRKLGAPFRSGSRPDASSLQKLHGNQIASFRGGACVRGAANMSSTSSSFSCCP